jgi:TonB-dependent starch-binding outer membrane protein SusC
MQSKMHGKKPLLAMVRFLLLIFFTSFYLKGFGQGISLKLKKAPLETAFRQIEAQVPQRFVYTSEMAEQGHAVTMHVEKVSLTTLLAILFKDQPLEYSLDEHFIKVRFKQVTSAVLNLVNVQGRVTNESGEALPNVSVTASASHRFTVTDGGGGFALKQLQPNEEIIFSSVGYTDKKVAINNNTYIEVQLTVSVSELDKAVVIAYGATTQRLNTGNVSKVTGAEINKRPVGNVLAALEGSVPGMIITQTSGVPGSSFKVQVQGQQSVGAKGNSANRIVSNDPLIIIDGVPFAAGNGNLNQLTSAVGNPDEGFGLSPLNLINPADIESIEVLKDADATAIYGSRGANGVIIITTKKGKPGKTKVQLNAYYGRGKVTRTASMLNTPQYVKMRLEGIANDGAVANTSFFLTSGYAPDLLLWDTTKYTDWKKQFIGGTAKTTDLNMTLSGGSENTQFFLGGGVHHETTVFPGDLGDGRASFRFNLNHTSTDKKLTVNFSANYADNNSKLNASDLTASINLMPILPALVDENGKLKWEDKGVLYSDVGVVNPLSSLHNVYHAESMNLIGNLLTSYRFSKKLSVRSSFGYNLTNADEDRILPVAYANPALVTTGSSVFGSRRLVSWIAEPQMEYATSLKGAKLQVLAGGSLQRVENTSEFISASGYTSDDLLRSLSAAGKLTGSNSFSEYKYSAVFGRVNYNLKNRYVLNFSGRRDGSSRFGPGNQFANFLAAGAAWIFSEEGLLKKLKPAFSYGKIKLSYGTTGNDQIGDYKFMSTWTSSVNSYQQIPVLTPVRLANPDYAWEVNRKLQAGIDVGFVNDRILITALFYRNRTNNQLVSYPLPIQTGFPGLGAKNIEALVENRGFEFTISTKNVSTKKFNWQTSAHITTGKNKLLAYPGLSISSYANTYVIGQSLNVIYKFDFLGIDPATGLYSFRDVNNDGVLNASDYVVSGNTDPNYYGAISNTIDYGRMQFSFLFEFRKQKGSDFRRDIVSSPGSFVNQPVMVLSRWQKPGDITQVQKFSAYFDSPASLLMTRFVSSNGAYSDASFCRLKNVWLSYQLPRFKKIPDKSASIFVEGQNIITWTQYKGADPENQSLYRLSPLRCIAAGIKITL